MCIGLEHEFADLFKPRLLPSHTTFTIEVLSDFLKFKCLKVAKLGFNAAKTAKDE